MKTYTEIKEGHPTILTEWMARLIEYRVILYGAAALGQAVKKALGNHGINVYGFWDLRHNEIDGAVEPYTTGDPSNTLVILCVGNTILQPEIVKEIQEHGYEHIMLGDLVYQALGCPLTDRVDGDACLRGPCRAIYCKRLQDIVKANCPPKADPPLFLHSITFVINQKCSLVCKYCSSYMNEYPAEDRVNFPKEQVIADIKAFFAAVDGVGTITVMGGEPFLHPDLSEIIQAILDCKNFGVISISTNGICKIKPSQLPALQDSRVNVSFSNYLSEVTEAQRDLFWRNIELLRSYGVPYTIGEPGPYWIVPSTLDVSDGVSVETLIQRKKDCDPVRCVQVKNGIIYPCDFINAVQCLNLGDYVDSRIHIGGALRADLLDFLSQDYYSACERCKGYGGSTRKAGEQGYVNMLGGEK